MSSQTPFGRRGLGAGATAPASFHNATRQAPAPTTIEPSPIIALLFGFQGRIPRLQYWLGQIGVVIVSRVAVFASQAIKTHLDANQASGGSVALALVNALVLLGVMILVIWIGLAQVVKRWHDRDKSGVWTLMGFVPILGWVWQGVECGFLEGTLGPNRFGPSPKGIAGVTYAASEADTFA